ncbi:LptF/LptG family permease [Nitratifractor salsuginis]|uniref:Permease YjgP/YjgQ family protein n=1 Tax=Nitratifractor salsuginis (strain DSM 16511 / JCM 12458 / E9I37-1) TaxID=749222 RepID=E6X2S6_NITSE|nr:LptF/LptG family permease [Nitratifractor salsuginis]ADV46142.1 permease YjgP/YjgQ family protein [Nitratifractor salsuginis DSM 16511]
MGKTRRYILWSFAKAYLLVFLPFLLVVSLIFVIQLSILSSRVNLEFRELVQLFGYMLPEIFFYTVPLSLIAALANTFTRFSEENEFIALFSLGHTPGKVLRFMIPTLLLFTALLLVLSVMLYPQMKQKLNHFKRQKIAEATLNISPNKLSQNFGSYHVFVESKDANDTYRNMVLFNQGTKGAYQLFIAREGRVANDGKRFTLTLRNGTGETSDPKKVENLHYRELDIYQYPRNVYQSIVTSREYWKKALHDKGRRGKLLYLIFVSLTPILAFGIIAALTFYNPRYQRSLSIAVIFITALAVYLPAAILQKSGSVPLFIALVIFLLALGIFLLRRRVLRSF